ncbi:hypothetical protein MBGDC06_00673 [Thermoplasmatales archaeon SCGC AB-539-C06]|nr:hypothetical protein MBGDC06_00673 [Thermoplasmatales archaeon SCGC AB-539-C06]
MIFNDLAKMLRRRAGHCINENHKERREAMKKAKEERDELVSKMRHHKELRNKLQEQAKKLIRRNRVKRARFLGIYLCVLRRSRQIFRCLNTGRKQLR